MVSNFKDRRVLEDCGFALSTTAQALSDGPGGYTYKIELDYGNMLGRATFVLIGMRYRRGLWYMAGYPQSMSQVLHDGERWQNAATDRFRRDYDNAAELLGYEHGGKAIKNLQKRSQFNMKAVQRWCLALRETEYTVTADVKQMADEVIAGPLSTQLVEEIHGVQQNRGRAKGSATFRRPEACMSLTLTPNILSNKHRYEPIAADMPVRSKMMRLPASAFRPEPGIRSIQFDDVVTTKPPDYYSPQANRNCQAIADFWLIKDCRQLHDGALDEQTLRNAWQGQLCDATHDMVIALRPPGTDDWSYYMPCANFSDSAVFCWPLDLLEIPGTRGSMALFNIRENVSEPVAVSIFNMCSKDLLACDICYKPPYCQYQDYPELRSWRPALRIFRESDWMTLGELAAYNGFWKLSRSVVEDVAEFNGVEVPAGANLATLVMTTCQAMTKKDGHDVLGMVYKRLTLMEKGAEWAQRVNELDEAKGVLEGADKRVVETQQEINAVEEAGFDVFQDEYKSLAREFYQKTAKEPAKKKKKSMPFRNQFEDAFDVPQKNAKKFIPPYAFIWRSKCDHAGWCGHLKPNKRVSCRFGAGTARSCKEALRIVCSALWAQHCRRLGLDLSQCPHDFSAAPA